MNHFNLSISNLAWNDGDGEKVYELMKRLGFCAIEIAPTKLFPQNPYEHIGEAELWAKNLKDKYRFLVSSMQSIWYGRSEKLFGTQSERDFLLDYTKRAVDFAAAVGCKNLVFGCPKNRAKPENASEEIAVAFFKELGGYAFSRGTCIGLEANPEIYGTNFVNTTREAFDLIQKVASPGFKLNLDIGTMIQNTESATELKGKLSLINHVHISEPFLKKIEKRSLHKEVASLLRAENYSGFVSIEMSAQNIQDIEEVMKYVKEIFR